MIAHHCLPGDLITLVGQLGAGKTQLVRGLAAGLGIDPSDVSSPTFVLIQEYTPPPPGPVLVHIDAYRVTGMADLESIGWLDNPLAWPRLEASPPTPPTTESAEPLLDPSIVVVEWADLLMDQIPPDRLEIRLDHLDDQRRQITLTAHGAWLVRASKLIEEIKKTLGNPR